MNDIMTISGIPCYEKDGTAYLNLEVVARGLGFTEIAASGNECVKWSRVRKYLGDLGVVDTSVDFIPENIFYRLAMKAKNAAAEKFQAKIADEVIPSIRRTGAYGIQRQMTPAELLAAQAQVLVDMERRQAALEEKVERAITAMAGPSGDHWLQDMNDAIAQYCAVTGLTNAAGRGRLYAELDRAAGCSTDARLRCLRDRKKKAGETRKSYMALTKLDAIAVDKQLRTAFEGVVQRMTAQAELKKAEGSEQLELAEIN